ncbi:hypothetical protein C2845_PM04G13010 [Panicum miliaceum]|uniref:Uncharacterized protein n=1 Tax=Panicum miliaceum TaxID=4540 RepID=A0A3L6QS70_PANMI|nr:hypothetical protein C2845_PM04G13010 [Panicum miliaceum]
MPARLVSVVCPRRGVPGSRAASCRRGRAEQTRVVSGIDQGHCSRRELLGKFSNGAQGITRPCFHKGKMRTKLRKAGMGASQKLDRKSCASSWQTGSRVGMVAAGASQLAQAYKTDQGGGHHDVHRMELNWRIFEDRCMDALQAVQESKTEVRLPKMACGEPELPSLA